MGKLVFIEQGHKSLTEISALDSRNINEMWYFRNELDVDNNTYHDIRNISQLGYKSFDGSHSLQLIRKDKTLRIRIFCTKKPLDLSRSVSIFVILKIHYL